MAITQVPQGSHTTTIAYEAGDSLAAIRALVLAFITGHGWELHESTTGSDVFKSLDYGGTAGQATHYTYVELDYSVSEVVCLRQWLSWAAGVGTQKAQNLKLGISQYATTVTEYQAGQPLNASSGGTLLLNVARGRLCLFGEIPGRSGNNNSGATMVIERMRVHPTDAVGVVPGGVFTHVGYLMATMQYCEARWAIPKAIDGSGDNASVYSGANGHAAIFFPGTGEFMGGGSTVKPVLVADSLSGDAIGSPCQLVLGNSYYSSNIAAWMGYLQGAIRRYGAAVGDIITAPADTLGIPTPGGTPTEYIVVPGGIGLVR